MTSLTPIAIFDWIMLNKPDLEAARPVEVTVGKNTYPGCWYQQWSAGPEDLARNLNEMIYLSGKLPKEFPVPKPRGRKPIHHFCITLTWDGTQDPREWYLGGYHQLGDPAGFHHIGGMTFRISPWQVPTGEKIDAHRRVPYTRVPVTVTSVPLPG